MIPLKLPPKIFAGTAAMYFAFLNYVKFFAFMHLGQVTMPNLTTSAVIVPSGYWRNIHRPVDR